MNKKEIRKQMTEIRDSLSKEEKSVKDAKIQDTLLSLSQIKESEAVFIYLSFRSEIDTLELLRQLWALGKKTYVPKVVNGEMDFYEISSFKELEPGFYGILEPVTTKCVSGCAGVMIMPGLAFDLQKNRIGYGGGYYDRYLEKYKNEQLYTIAAAYDFQVVEKLEVEGYDYPVDILVTETRIL